MGHMLSKAASRAVAGRLDKGLQKYRNEMEKDVLRNIQAKQQQATPGGFTDPNAMDGGFTRGHGAQQNLRDAEQEAFLKSRQTGPANQEMPADLIQFLNDMGPVTRKKVEGPRLRKQMQEELEEPRGRQKREMPIMEETTFTTSRTTNFSRRQEEADKFGMTGRELYQLLQTPADKTEEAILSKVQGSVDATEEEKQAYSDLLQNSLKYLQVPVIMKDTDKSYVGAWPDSVPDMTFMKLKLVPESQVRILLAVEDPDEQK